MTHRLPFLDGPRSSLADEVGNALVAAYEQIEELAADNKRLRDGLAEAVQRAEELERECELWSARLRGTA